MSAAAPLALSAAPVSRKANFVFILADDHAGYVMGCDGNRKAETPNLDRLASEGTRFAANYCNSPVCTPSRQSFLTGQLPHAAGVTVLKTPLADDKPTIAKQLKRLGYQTAVFGKMHFNRPGQPGLHGFDIAMTEGEITRAWQKTDGNSVDASIRTKPLPWRPFQTPAAEWLNANNLPYPRNDDGMRSSFLVRQVDEYLQQNKDQTFGLWVSFQEPHSPFDFPVDYRSFQPDDFQAPRTGPEDDWQIPLIFRKLSAEQKQGIIAAYYNSARFLDHNVGRVLRLLEKYNLAENTLVVYMADHGYSLGQHGRFEKHCGYDPALRVPLIFRWPGKVRSGVVVRSFTESVDVPHTILDLLNAPELPVRHGESLRSYLAGRRPERVRDHIFSEYLENEEAYIRTATHKYIYCTGRRKRSDGYETANPTPGPYEQLFELNSDPAEFHNVAHANPQVVARLRRLMLKRFEETHPEAHATAGLDFYLRPRDADA